MCFCAFHFPHWNERCVGTRVSCCRGKYLTQVWYQSQAEFASESLASNSQELWRKQEKTNKTYIVISLLVPTVSTYRTSQIEPLKTAKILREWQNLLHGMKEGDKWVCENCYSSPLYDIMDEASQMTKESNVSEVKRSLWLSKAWQQIIVLEFKLFIWVCS